MRSSAPTANGALGGPALGGRTLGARWARRAASVLLLASCARPPSACLEPRGCEPSEATCAQGVCAAFAHEGDEIVLWLDNQNPLSATVLTDLPVRENLEPSVDLPVRTVVPPRRRVEAVRLARRHPAQPFQLSSSIQIALGSPDARHDETARYAMPFGGDEARLLGQGVDGGVTHVGVYRYAFDFDMPEGTPVLAARAGTVVRVIDGFERGAFDPNLKERGNAVLVAHEDETIATYGHLSSGIPVREGETVEVGQRLGLSGATGYVKGAHLHFHVGTVAEAVEGATLPIRFDDGTPDGYVPEPMRRYGPSPERRSAR